MARRVSALIGMVIILGLAAILVWRVYLHHQASDHEDEIVIVSADTPDSDSALAKAGEAA